MAATEFFNDDFFLGPAVKEENEFAAYDVFCSAKGGVDVNARYMDATPLFYACLCGHYELCEYLLEKGAFCAENTYDGDRCLYGALTEEIRDLLRIYATRHSPVSAYAQQIGHLRTSLLELPGCEPDICFCLKGKEIPCHKAILAGRIPSIDAKIRPGGKWYQKETIALDYVPSSFEALVKYCYMDVVDISFNEDESFLEVCLFFGMSTLYEEIKPRFDKAKDTALKKSKNARMMSTKMGRFLDVSPLKKKSLASDLRRVFLYSNGYKPEHVKSFHWSITTTLKCNGINFYAHSYILCSRSKYFSTMLNFGSGNFASQERNPDCLDLNHLSPSNLVIILDYLYADKVDFKEYVDDNVEEMLRLLDATTEMMLPDLQSLLSKYLIDLNVIDMDNVFDWLDIADLYDAGVIRSYCTSIIGEYFINMPFWNDFEYTADGVAAWDSLEKENENLQNFASHLVKLKDKKDPRQEKEWYKPQGDREETAADFLIAEVREAMIESKRAIYLSMATRDTITDGFEDAAEIWRQRE